MNVLVAQQQTEAAIRELYTRIADLQKQVRLEQERLRKLPTVGKAVTAPGYFRGEGRVKAVCGAYVVVDFNEVIPVTVKIRASWVQVIDREPVRMQPRKPWQSDTRRPTTAIVPAAPPQSDAAFEEQVAEAIARSNERVAETADRLRMARLERHGKIIGGTYVIRPD